MKFLLILIISALTLSAYPQPEKLLIENAVPEFKSLFNNKMQPNVSCYRIPAIVTAPNGDLIAAIDGIFIYS